MIDNDTPRRRFLKRRIHCLKEEITKKDKKMKSLQQTVRRQKKKIASLETILEKLKTENLINEDAGYILSESFGKHKDLITNFAKKNLGKKVSKKYCSSVRQFALSLHFFSAKAYAYVRQQFNTILPHPRTLSKWYSNIDADPGFTEEALKYLTLKVKHSSHPIYCSLMMDEMAIRQHLEYDGVKYYGRIDMGNGFTSNDNLDIAKECFVLMVVSINENWKLPIGYFLVNSLNSSQKMELIKHALNLLENTGVIIISLTFDGCSTNITTAKLLGCNFNVNSLCTSFCLNNTHSNIVTFMDPAHMVKLIRNAFGEKKQFLDEEDNLVNFEYIVKLFMLQEKEGCHLANKLRKIHIFYYNQKMKVKLASQLLSQSVADALKFCRDNLKLREFSEVGATIKFIEMFNIAFDILNSRSVNCIGYKKALCVENYEEISKFATIFTEYIIGLKVKEKNGFVPVLESNRKTGFIGFVGDLNSISKLYSSFIKPGKLDYIKLYKCSQDHLELFFGSVRGHGGYNNNPTARQFRSAYKKLVIQMNNIQSFNTGNCVQLDNIDILHYSSRDPIKVLNNNSLNLSSDSIVSQDILNSINSFIMDHDYIDMNHDYSFSLFTKEVIIYVSGFVVYKLSNSLKCEPCKLALISKDKEKFLNSLITLKNKGGKNGGLMYPNDDVISICFKTERYLKEYNYTHRTIDKLEIQSKVLAQYLHNSTIFSCLEKHSQEETHTPLTDHITLLIKSIISTYISLKINYSLKSHNETTSLRQHYNKLVLFKGQ